MAISLLDRKVLLNDNNNEQEKKQAIGHIQYDSISNLLYLIHYDDILMIYLVTA